MSSTGNLHGVSVFRESTFAAVVKFLPESKSIYGEESVKLAQEALMKTRN